MSDLPSLFESIAETEDEKHKISYLPSPFVAASLPLRDVKAPSFKRKFNNLELYLTGSPKVPFGKYARLVLSLLTTKAVISPKVDEISFNYDTLSHLTDELLLPRQRGKDIREQLVLFSLSSFQYREKKKQRIQKSLFDEYNDDDGFFNAVWNSHGNIPFMKNLQWVDLEDEKTGKVQNTIGFTVTLSKEFVELCKNHSVPIDYTVYSQISSPLGKDLYAWIIYRNNILTEDEELFVPRKAIVAQFGTGGSEMDNKSESQTYISIVDKLTEIKSKYYPNLKITFESSNMGFTLRKSKTIIAPNDKRYVLVTNFINF